jgi:hypothetical protein
MVVGWGREREPRDGIRVLFGVPCVYNAALQARLCLKTRLKTLRWPRTMPARRVSKGFMAVAGRLRFPLAWIQTEPSVRQADALMCPFDRCVRR